MQDWVYELQCDNSEFIQTRYRNLTSLESSSGTPVDIFTNPAGDRTRICLARNLPGSYALYNLQNQLVRSVAGLSKRVILRFPYKHCLKVSQG